MDESLNVYILDDSHVISITLENGYTRTDETFANNAAELSPGFGAHIEGGKYTDFCISGLELAVE